MLVRVGFFEGVGRYRRLFSKTPPTRTVQFTERVPERRLYDSCVVALMERKS
jgi:hypothetical protein